MVIFPSNVVEIELFKPRLNHDSVKAFGNDVFYERLLLMYVCEDWTSVVKFKTNSMAWEEYQDEETDDDDDGSSVCDYDPYETCFDNLKFKHSYHVNYLCKPTANEETIFVKHSKVAINELISKNNQGLLVTKLMYYHHSFKVPIPANVRHLSILFDDTLDDDFKFFFEHRHYPYYGDFELVLEDPTALLVLRGCHSGFTGRLATFPNVINLRELEIIECDKNLLVSIVRSRASLSKLTLNCPMFGTFGKMSADIKSLSLKCLTIIDGSDTFQDIVKHFPSLNSLTLEEYHTEPILKSDVNAIKGLQYFKFVVNGNKEVAVHLSSLQFPYMLFLYYRSSHYYAASRGLELVNEISRSTSRNNMVKARRSIVLHLESDSVSEEVTSLIYVKNIASRFIRNSYHLVYTVQDFLDNIQSTKYD